MAVKQSQLLLRFVTAGQLRSKEIRYPLLQREAPIRGCRRRFSTYTIHRAFVTRLRTEMQAPMKILTVPSDRHWPVDRWFCLPAQLRLPQPNKLSRSSWRNTPAAATYNSMRFHIVAFYLRTKPLMVEEQSLPTILMQQQQL